ncbi:uncharacterized protein LOC105839959 [Monomorium pharaonis]|uniref:uncharacterized protein LOC105839959 n=1 Tax=Monomorium pharaonis TaxID=307658 RepID=UPI001747798D|nr:uncharacterized protein LOC105839959 [Monomorium pharaonis]
MFAIFFTFMFVTAYTADKIPSYIHPCGRKDPNYSQCFADNIDSVKSKICTGIMELNLPPQEPLIVDKIIIYDMVNLKLILKDSKIKGLCNLNITSHNASSDRLYLEFSFTVKNLTMDSMYNFDLRLLVSLANEGLVRVTLDKIDGKISVDLEEIIKNDKKQIYVSKVNTILKIKKFNYEFDETEKNLAQLYEVIKKTVDENNKEIINIVKQKLEGVVSKLFIFVFNTVVHNRFEQLFPDEA